MTIRGHSPPVEVLLSLRACSPHDSAANNFDSGGSELTGGTTQETRLPVDYGEDVSTLTIEPFFEGPAGSGQGGWTARRSEHLDGRIRLLCVIRATRLRAQRGAWRHSAVTSW